MARFKFHEDILAPARVDRAIGTKRVRFVSVSKGMSGLPRKRTRFGEKALCTSKLNRSKHRLETPSRH